MGHGPYRSPQSPRAAGKPEWHSQIPDVSYTEEGKEGTIRRGPPRVQEKLPPNRPTDITIKDDILELHEGLDISVEASSEDNTEASSDTVSVNTPIFGDGGDKGQGIIN